MGKQYIINEEDLEKLSEEEKEIVLKFLKEYGKELEQNKSMRDPDNGQIIEDEELDADQLINNFEEILNQLMEYRNRLVNGEFREGRFIQEEHLKEIRSQLDSLNLGMKELSDILGGDERLDELMSKADDFEEQFKVDEKEYANFNEKRETAQEISERQKRGNIQQTATDKKREEFLSNSYNKEGYQTGEVQNSNSYEKYLEDSLDEKVEEQIEEEIKEEKPITLKPKNPYDFTGF